MSDETPRLKLPQLLLRQAISEAKWSEALAKLDAMVDLSLKGLYVNDPPSSPSDGDAYLTGGSPGGDWNNSAYKLAVCLDGGWRIYQPFDGLRAFVEPSRRYISYHGGQWRDDGASGTPIDIFLIAGQSNACGRGDAALSPVPASGTALQYYNGTISPAVDPVGNAASGSAWPSFAAGYFTATRRAVAFVPAAVGGTSQCAAADTGSGNWDASGTLTATAIAALQAALAAFAAAGYAPQLCGILWCQGEADAAAIAAGTITQSTYQSALAAMIARYRDSFGAALPFYIFKTGTKASDVDTGFAAVRSSQDAVAAADPFARIVFGNAAGFPARGLDNAVHYTQAGYNEMGRIGAASVVAGLDQLGFTALGNGQLFYDQGQILIGRAVTVGGSAATVEAIGGAGFAAPGYGLFKSTRFGGNGAFICQRINGTPQAPAGCVAGDMIGGLFAAAALSTGAMGTNIGVAAFHAAETFTPTTQGSYFAIQTTPIGATGRREVLRLTAQGRLRMNLSAPPLSAADTGEAGETAWDADYVYVCVAANTWKRAALASW